MKRLETKFTSIFLIIGVFAISLLLSFGSALATTYNVSCNGTITTALQNAINSAKGGSTYATGDTVSISAGSCSMGDITLNKKITLQGAGASSTTISGGSITSTDSAPRITGIGFTNTTITINESTTGGSNGWRVDHNNFSYTSRTYAITVQGGSGNSHPTGVVDNNAFTDGEVLTYGNTNDYGTPANASNMWALTDPLGAQTNVVYVETNTFTWDSGATPPTSIDGNYGARVVFRFNNLISGGLELHGIQGTSNRGVSRWEIYNNTFNISFAWYCGTLIRSGGGVIFNNTYGSNFTNAILIENQTSYRYSDYSCNQVACDGNNPRDQNTPGMYGYACRDQIGRGRDLVVWAVGQPFTQTLEGLYSWNNTFGGSMVALVFNYDTCQCGSCDTNYMPIHIVKDRDYYDSASGPQTSPTTPFDGSSGVGFGTLANRPTTCTTTSESGGGVAYWATDQGSWNQSGSGGQGVLYKCTATNTWTQVYTPLTYPHPLANPGPPDTQPPTTPTNLSASAVSSSQINLTWTASTDNVGVAGYKIYRCTGSGCTPSSLLTTAPGTSYSDTGLSASTVYVYAVSAYDAAGNESAKSTSASATTQSGQTTATLGYNTIGGNTDYGNENNIHAARYTMPNQNGTVTSMSVYVASPISPSPNNQYQLAIYSDSNGSPGSLIASSQSATLTGNAWNTVSISANLSANTSYWLAYNTNAADDNSNNSKYDNSSANQTVWKAQTFGSWPSSFGNPSGSSPVMTSIYATYSVGSPPAPPTGFVIQ